MLRRHLLFYTPHGGYLIVLLICKLKPGASGAKTSVAQLQAAARGGSGLTKGERCNKLYDYNTAFIDVATSSEQTPGPAPGFCTEG